MAGAHPAGWVAGPLGVCVAALAALASLDRAPLPDIPSVALYVEPSPFAWWLAPLSGLLAAAALGLRTRRWPWSLVVGALLALAPPLGAMPLALLALSLAALPGGRRQG